MAGWIDRLTGADARDAAVASLRAELAETRRAAEALAERQASAEQALAAAVGRIEARLAECEERGARLEESLAPLLAAAEEEDETPQEIAALRTALERTERRLALQAEELATTATALVERIEAMRRGPAPTDGARNG